MMLVLLVYPMRKRFRILSFLGPIKHWFRFHMIFGLGGPVLVLYHCNFQYGSFNSKVALYSMLVVAGSGIIGRHIYARIHLGLYGRKTELQELQDDLRDSIDSNQEVAVLMPQLMFDLERTSAELLEDQFSQSIRVGRSLKWFVQYPLMLWSLKSIARRELESTKYLESLAADQIEILRRQAGELLTTYVRLLGRVVQFSFYERMFSLWHVLHLPLFLAMVLAALVHVLAVHMY